MPFRAGILTVSDKGAAGEREDTSGAAIRELLSGIGATIDRYEIIADERDLICERLAVWADEIRLDVIVTTGGTGLGPRDVTPEATLDVIGYEVPGLAETMRAEGLKHTPMSMLSRAVAGVRGRTLIVNLPGSPKGVRENLSVILPVLPHALELLRGERSEHNARTDVGRNGEDISAINAFLQRKLSMFGSDATANEAAQWLDGAGILRDDPSRPGRNLRRLLRQGVIQGARQEPPAAYGRWFISAQEKAGHISDASTRKAPAIVGTRLPPSLKQGVDIVIVGTGPVKGGQSLKLGCYYADGRNNFWADLHEAGFTATLFEPRDYTKLLDLSPSVGLDDIYDDPQSLLERIGEHKPRILVFNSRKAHALVRGNRAARTILAKFDHLVLDDSSGMAAAYRNRRLNALKELRRRFP